MMKPARFEDLTADDLAKTQTALDGFFRAYTGPGDEFSLAYESARSQVDPPKLLAVLNALCLGGQCNLSLAVYHTCEEHRVDLVPLGKDVHIPFRCDGCEEMVEDEEEISYDVIATFDKKLG